MTRSTPAPRAAGGLALALLAIPGLAVAGEPAAPAAPQTTVTASAYWYVMRDQPDFGVGVAALDRGPVHLEARYNYEVRNTGSLFAGWTLAGGEDLTFELTPIVGGMFGAARGVVPGFEASVAYRQVDLYIEAEYVRNFDDTSASYAFAWSELGWRPAPWLRVGLAGQRTRTIDNGRDLQRGVFGQVSAGKATLGAYAFNPDVGSRYLIVYLGLQL